MPLKKRRYWTEDDSTYLRTKYGVVATRQICAYLGRTQQEVWSKARHSGLTETSFCRACRKPFPSPLGKRTHYCSKICKRAANTRQHRDYVAGNREHIREYVKARKLRVWGESGPEVALKAEEVSVEMILPRLGFSNLYHASAFNRFVPFDVIATYKGQRVLIDVTTALTKGKSTSYQKSFAEALGMPIFVLFVKPDMTKYFLKRWDGAAKSMAVRLSELASIE